MEQRIDPKKHSEVERSGFEEPDGSRPTSGKAFASFVLGLASLPLWILAAIPAITLGIVSLKQINRSDGQMTGRALAIAGLVMGGLGLIVAPAVFSPRSTRRASRRVAMFRPIT